MITLTSVRRPMRRCLTAVGIVGGVLFAAPMAASAGECPANQVVADGQGQKTAPTKPKDVTDNVLTRIDLVNEPVMLKDHALRLRRLVVKPGGIVPWHTHTDRPAIIYIISGTITEYRSTCKTPIVHKAGRVHRRGQGHLALVEEHRQEDGRAAVGRLVPRQGRPAHDVALRLPSVRPDPHARRGRPLGRPCPLGLPRSNPGIPAPTRHASSRGGFQCKPAPSPSFPPP